MSLNLISSIFHQTHPNLVHNNQNTCTTSLGTQLAEAPPAEERRTQRRPRLWTTPPVSSRAKRRDDRTSEEKRGDDKENAGAPHAPSWASHSKMVDPNFMTPVKPNLRNRLSLGAPGVLRRTQSSRAASQPRPRYFESDEDEEDGGSAGLGDDLDDLAGKVMLMDVRASR
jgi:hypothetical protein